MHPQWQHKHYEKEPMKHAWTVTKAQQSRIVACGM